MLRPYKLFKEPEVAVPAHIDTRFYSLNIFLEAAISCLESQEIYRHLLSYNLGKLSVYGLAIFGFDRFCGLSFFEQVVNPWIGITQEVQPAVCFEEDLLSRRGYWVGAKADDQ